MDLCARPLLSEVLFKTLFFQPTTRYANNYPGHAGVVNPELEHPTNQSSFRVPSLRSPLTANFRTRAAKKLDSNIFFGPPTSSKNFRHQESVVATPPTYIRIVTETRETVAALQRIIGISIRFVISPLSRQIAVKEQITFRGFEGIISSSSAV